MNTSIPTKREVFTNLVITDEVCDQAAADLFAETGKRLNREDTWAALNLMKRMHAAKPVEGDADYEAPQD